MTNTTGKRLFAAVCAAAPVFSVLFIFVFSRQIVPETQEHNFPVVISYERGGEPVSEAAVYCCAYQSGGEWIGWFEHSGTDDALYVEEADGSVWVVSLS